MLKFSTSEENYIKAIYHLQDGEVTVTTNDLAKELHTRPASVTDMMKKLKAKKLLHYQPYQGFRLSPEGSKVALGIIRRHRLWEYFLAEKLEFSWDEVHEVAEDLEHVGSKKLIDRLDAFLGFPRFDPHGDPIPDINGKMKPSQQVSLSEVALNRTVVVRHVADQSAGLLELLRHKKISIGTRMEVKKRFDYDQSVEIRIKPHRLFTISEQSAKNIFVSYGE